MNASEVVESIDVLLPVYALADRPLLARAVASVFAQQCPAQILWVLINGGSAADRQDLVAAVNTLVPPSADTVMQVVVLDQQGITAALNRGLALSQAQWLARLDADDRMLPQRFQNTLLYLQACRQAGRPVPDVIGSAMAVLDAHGHEPTGQVLRRPGSDRAIRRYLCIGNPFLHPSVMMRRSVLAAAGGYRPSPGTEDLDLWLRLARFQGVIFANLNEALTLYTLRPGSLSHQRDSFLRSALCRWRHCNSPQRVLIYAPKVLSDLLRYGLEWLVSHLVSH